MSSRTIAKNSVWSALDLVINLAFALVGSVLVARLMGPEKLGRYNYILWIANITGVVVSFGIPLATRKYAAEFIGKGDLVLAHTIVRVTTRIQLLMGIVLVGAWLLWTSFRMPEEQKAYTAVAVLSILPYMMTSLLSQANMAAEDFRSNAVASLVSSTVGFVGLIAALALGWDLLGLTMALLVSRLTDYGFRLAAFRRYFPALPDHAEAGGWSALPPELRKRLLRFCWDSSVLQVINIVVWNRSQLIFLERYCDIREVSYYSLGFNVIEKIGLIPQVFVSAAGASVMVGYGRDGGASAGRVTGYALRYVALITLPLLLGAAAVSDPFIRSLYGGRYLPAVLPFALQALLGVPRTFFLPFRQLLIAGDHQNFLVRWGLLSAVVVLALNYLLIPSGGAVGASVANGVGQLVAVAGAWAFAARRYRIPVAWRAIAGIGGAAGVSCGAAALAARIQPPQAALPISIVTGAVLFPLFLRMSSSLNREDRSRLMEFERHLPAPLRGFFRKAVEFLAPAA